MPASDSRLPDAGAHDERLREAPPNTELRERFGHDPDRWDEVRCRYRAELKAIPEPVERCPDRGRGGPVALLYAAPDGEHNQAVLLQRLTTRGGNHDRFE